MLKLPTNHLMEPLHITKLSVSCFGLINKRRIVILDPRALLAPKVGSELTSKMFIYLTQTSIRFCHDFPTFSSLLFLLKIIQKYFFTRWILVVMVTNIAEILPSLLDFFEISVCIWQKNAFFDYIKSISGNIVNFFHVPIKQSFWNISIALLAQFF